MSVQSIASPRTNQVENSLQEIIKLLGPNLFAKRNFIQLIKTEPQLDDCPIMQVDLRYDETVRQLWD